MSRPLLLALMASLVLAGCATEESEPEAAADDVSPIPTVSPSSTRPLAYEESDEDVPAPEEAAMVEPTPAATAPPPASAPGKFDMTPTTAAPAGDSDRDGILDARERALAADCTVGGRSCADLGIKAPTVGVRDLVFVQLGRSGTMQDWRYPAAVWASVVEELANLSIVVQVADVGSRDDINVSSSWEDPSNDGKFWHLWVIYNDPATAVAEGSAGTQLYDLVTLAERGDVVEERATILHESYHALLGSLDGGRSLCTDEEVGGPSHSGDEGSVLYTSPDCETNEGSVFRLGESELRELREQPFAALAEMNEPGWPSASFES